MLYLSNTNLVGISTRKLANNLYHYTFFLLFRQGEAIRICVEKSLLKCKDPTPRYYKYKNWYFSQSNDLFLFFSNVVNSLLLSMKNATPCRNLEPYSWTAASAPSLKAVQGQISIMMTSILLAILNRGL